MTDKRKLKVEKKKYTDSDLADEAIKLFIVLKRLSIQDRICVLSTALELLGCQPDTKKFLNQARLIRKEVENER